MARSLAAQPSSSGWAPPIGRLSRALPFALPRRVTPKRLAIALAVLALFGGGWLWLRSSPLVSVQRVEITGVQGVDASQIDAALRTAAKRMSTLNVSVAGLRAVVAQYRVVKSVSVATDFPHGLRIHVVEQPPVAEVSAPGIHTAVAADGVVLGPDLLAAAGTQLPSIALAGFAVPTGGKIDGAAAREQLSVLGAAPRVLLGWVAKVFNGGEGLTVQMRNGVSIYFGDATRPHAKWLAAARVLADPSSVGATYVDVRDPERPAAGTTAAGGMEGAAGAGGVSASDPNSAAVAQALAEAVSGGATSTSGTTSAGAATTPAAAATPAATTTPAAATTPAVTTTAAQTTAAPTETEENSLSTSG
jgi:cell division protein FtsQ